MRKVMNVSPTQQCVNLDTMGPKGERENRIFSPRQVWELTDEQFQSREVQKLLTAKIFIDRTAAEAKSR